MAMRSMRCSPRRCPYLKTPIASSAALAAVALLIIASTACLSGLGGSVSPYAATDVAESHAGVRVPASRQDRPRRGKRGKQRAVTSSFHHDRAAAVGTGAGAGADSSHEDLEVSSWVWVSQVDRARGFSLAHTVADGLRAEVAVLSDELDEECAEGWQGDMCLECAPGYSGDFCTLGAPQVDLYNYQVKVPPSAEIHLRDYLPSVPSQGVRGTAVFSAGVNVAQADASVE